MHTVIEPAERAVLEEKLRSVLGSGAATTALLKLLDKVNEELAPYSVVACPGEYAEEVPEVITPDVPEVQVTESSP